MIQVAIHGASGRMGQRLCALTLEDPRLDLLEAIDGPGRFAPGSAAVAGSPVLLTDRLSASPDVVIDFSVPGATRQAIAHCRAEKLPLIIGTTGLTPEDDQAITQAGADIPILWASNFSRVVNVLNHLAALATTLLGDDYDLEILEAHHRFKKDAPSGTAITLAKTLAQAAGRSFEKDVVFCRHGDDVPRKPTDITVQTLRLGDHVGEHTAYFAAMGERLEIKHVSTNRDSYVRGALHAGAWLVSQPAGRYTMNDVLGLGKVAAGSGT